MEVIPAIPDAVSVLLVCPFLCHHHHHARTHMAFVVTTAARLGKQPFSVAYDAVAGPMPLDV
eukprot:7536185-Lingulodinium_polyedra.AAC.1